MYILKEFNNKKNMQLILKGPLSPIYIDQNFFMRYWQFRRYRNRNIFVSIKLRGCLKLHHNLKRIPIFKEFKFKVQMKKNS